MQPEIDPVTRGDTKSVLGRMRARARNGDNRETRHLASPSSDQPIPRPYQTQAICGLRRAMAEFRRVLLVLPTGAGKTFIAATVGAGAYAKGKRLVFLVHRVELVEQASRAFTEAGIPHGKITAGCELTDEPVQIASVQTLVRRLDKIPAPDLVFLDEAHHAVAGTWRTILDLWPAARVIGLTATPERLDGRGLGDVFEHMIIGPSTADLIEQGYLCRYRAFAPAGPDLSKVRAAMGEFHQGDLSAAMCKPTVIGDILDTYQRHGGGKQAIMFATSPSHSRALVESFNAAGISAEHVDGETASVTRKQAVAAFSRGEIRVLSNCDLFGEGFDVPAAEVVILARPTQSLGLHLQQIGRVLRPAAGKANAVIFDHAGNLARHGLPDDIREWSLDAVKRKSRSGSAGPAVRTCPACFCCHRPAAECPECGHSYAPKSRKIEFRAGDLVEIPSGAPPVVRQSELKSYDELVAYGRAKGMKNPNGWARHVMAGRQRRAA
jgi:DNA repair protein RadD